MNILDRITLLRAGYSRKEIEEMIKEEQAKPEEQKQKEPCESGDICYGQPNTGLRNHSVK